MKKHSTGVRIAFYLFVVFLFTPTVIHFWAYKIHSTNLWGLLVPFTIQIITFLFFKIGYDLLPKVMEDAETYGLTLTSKEYWVSRNWSDLEYLAKISGFLFLIFSLSIPFLVLFMDGWLDTKFNLVLAMSALLQFLTHAFPVICLGVTAEILKRKQKKKEG